MATTKFKLRASTVSGKQGTLIIQVIHKRMVRQLSTKYKLYPEEWDARRQSVVIHEHTATHRCLYLQTVHEAVQLDASRLQLIILTLDHSRKDYHAEDVVKQFFMKEKTDDFTTFAAGALIIAVPFVIFFIFTQKAMMMSMGAAAVKE